MLDPLASNRIITMKTFKIYNRIQEKNGQAVIEYTALLVIVALALLGIMMGGYFRSALMGRMQSEMGRTFGTEEYKSGTSPTQTRTVTTRMFVNPFASWF